MVFICWFIQITFLANAGSVYKYTKQNARFITTAVAPADTIIYTGTGKVCPTGNVVLSVASQPGGTTYKWYKNGVPLNGPTSTAPTYTVQPTALGSYHVVVSGIGYPAFVVQASSLSADFTFSSPAQCANVPIQFTTTSPDSPVSYLWDFGDPNSGSSNTSAEQNPSHTFIGSTGDGNQTFNVRLTVRNIDNCSLVITKSVSVKKLPGAILGGSGSKVYDGKDYFTSCTGNTTTFTFTNQSNSTNTNYKISWGDGSPDYEVASFNSVSHSYAVGINKLTYTVTGLNGCGVTKEYYVFVGSNPAVGLGNPGNTIVCTSGSLTFPITGTENNPPGTTYTVTFNDGSPPVVLNHPLVDNFITHTFTKTSCGTTSNTYANSFSASIQASNPCSSSSALVVPIYVSEKPAASFSVLPQANAYCTNSTIPFANTSKGNTVSAGGCASGKSVWSITPSSGWSISSGSLGKDFGVADPDLWQSGTTPLMVKFTTPGEYKISIKTGTSGCGSDIIEKTICINPPPIASFSIDKNSGCAPLSVKTVNDSTLPTCGSNTYSWTIAYSGSTSGCLPNAAAFTLVNGTSLNSPNPEFLFTNAGTYTVSLITKNSDGACISSSVSKQITVKAKPVVSITAPPIVCSGANFLPSATVLNCYSQTTATYSWSFPGSNTPVSSSSSPGPIVYPSPGLYTISLDVMNECGTTTVSKSITVTDLPSVNTLVDREYCKGASTGIIAFSGSIANTTYSWVNNNTQTGLVASGTGSIQNFITTNTGNSPQISTITITPIVNGCSGPSVSFKLTVNPAPPKPSATTIYNYCLNEAATTLTAIPAADNDLIWYSSSALVNGTPTPPLPSTSVAGTFTFYVTQKNSSGCEGPAETIAVNVTNPVINNNISGNQTVCFNSAAQILTQGSGTVSGGGTLNYQWQVSIDNGNTWSNISAATSSTYSPGIINSPKKYRRLVNTSNCSSISNIVDVALSGQINSYDISNSQSICKGEIPALLTGEQPTGGIGSFSYQWQSSITSPSAGFTNISGASMLSYQPQGLNQTTYFKRLTTSGQCSVSSSVVTVSIKATPVLSSSLSPPSVCNGSLFSYNPTSAVGTSFSWSRAAVTGISNPEGSGNGNPNEILVNTTAAPVSVKYIYTLIANGCSNTQDITVIVNSTPLLTSSINPITACSGTKLNYTPTSNIIGTSFSWSRAAVLGISNAASQGTGNITETLLNSTNLPVTVSYFYTLNASGCTSPQLYKLDVIVSPSPKLTSTLTAPAICSGDTFVYNITTDMAGSSSSWTRSVVAGILNPASSGTGSINEILTNTLSVPVVVSYSVTSTINSCSRSQAVTVTVNPAAKADFSASRLSNCVPFNLGPVITVLPDNNRNSSYEWYANNTLIGTGSAFPGYVITTASTTVAIKLVAFSKFGCIKNEKTITFSTASGIDASFSSSVSSGCGPLTVQFTNTSEPLNSANYEWDFGNKQKATSVQPPVIVYKQHPLNRDTTYIITLKAITSCGVSVFRDSVTVRSKPIALFSPDKTTGCSPLDVVITNQSRGVPNTYTYDFGDGTRITKTDNQTITHRFLTARTDTFTVKLIAENECGSDSSYYNVIVYPNTVKPELVVSGNQRFGCAPFTVTFDNHSEGANSFKWDFNDGTTTVTDISPASLNHTFTQPGNYVIKLLASNGCSSSETTETITVYPKILSNFSILKDQVCIGQIVAFTNLTPSNSCFWDFGDGATSNDENPTHSFSSPGTYDVKLTVIQSFPNGTNCSTSSIKQIHVLALPTLSFSSNSGLINCSPFVLNVQTPSANSSSITWDFGDPNGLENVAAGASASHTFTSAGIYTIKVRKANSLGCQDSSVQIIRIKESPKALFKASQTSVCGTFATIAFTNLSTYPPGINTQRWFINNIQISTDRDFVNTFQLPEGAALPYKFTVQLLIINEQGCRDSVSQVIQFNLLPKAAFNISTVQGCSPFKIIVSNNSLNADKFDWYLNNKLISSTKNLSDILLDKPNTTYVLKLVADNAGGCIKDSIETTIQSYPKPKSLFAVKDSISCNGKLDLLITNISTGATSYRWNFGDGSAESNQMVPMHTYSSPGSYYLKLITDNGFCRDTMITTIKVAAPVQAAYIANNTKGCTLITATFQNLSVNGKSYLWDFGDGTFSGDKNPTHIFSYIKSPYTVKLIVTGEFGCTDSVVFDKYINVSAPAKADFSVLPGAILKIPDFRFTFKDLSSGTPTAYKWDFGDGKTATIQNPQHLYEKIGLYSVKLIVSNNEGCSDTISKIVQIIGVEEYLYVPNAFEPGNNNPDLKTFKVKGTGLTSYSLRIFNKWGEMIWQSQKIDTDGVPGESWDGTMGGQPAPQGVYVWDIEAHFISGLEWKGMKYETGLQRKTGVIHLIR